MRSGLEGRQGVDKKLLKWVFAASCALAAFIVAVAHAEDEIPAPPVEVGGSYLVRVACTQSQALAALTSQTQKGQEGYVATIRMGLEAGACTVLPPIPFRVHEVIYVGLFDDGHNWLAQIGEDLWFIVAMPVEKRKTGFSI